MKKYSNKSNVGKTMKIVNMKFSFFKHEIKMHFFCKKRTEIIAGKRNKKSKNTLPK